MEGVGRHRAERLSIGLSGPLVGASGRFELGERLGRGGWGEVRAAVHRPSGVQAAIKLLPCRSDRDAARVRLELAALARLRHRHIVSVFDHGVHGEIAWLATERARGSLAGQSIPLERLPGLITAVLEALAHAHARGVVHRDVKPSNLLWSQAGVLRLADLGAAWLAEGRLVDRVGTPAFMAPEQASGTASDLGAWTDLYAVGRLVLAATRDAAWTDWGHWLARPDPAARPASAAEALARLPGTGAPVALPASVAATVPFDDGTLDDGTVVAFEGPLVLPDARPAQGRRDDLELPADWRRPLEPPDHLLRAASSALVHLRAPRLIGREGLQDRLWAALREADRPRRLVLSGRPGSGRTALLDWLAEAASEHGATVWRARAGDDASALLRSALGLHGEVSDGIVARAVYRIGGDEPALEAILAGVRAGAAGAALRRLLRQVPGPRLVAVEEGARLGSWLEALADEDVPVLVVEVRGAEGTAEGGEVAEVGLLDEAEMGAILEDLLPLAPGTRRALVERGAGRPGRVVRSLRRLAAEDGLVRDGEVWRAGEGALEGLVGEATPVWQARIAALSTPMRDALVEQALLGPLARVEAHASEGVVAGFLDPARPEHFVAVEAAEALREVATTEDHVRAAGRLEGVDRVDAHARRGSLLARAGRLIEAREALQAACWGAMEAGATYAEVLERAEALDEVLGRLGQRDALARRVRSIRMTCRMRCGDLDGAEALAREELARDDLDDEDRARVLAMRSMVAGLDGRAHDGLALLDAAGPEDTLQRAMQRIWILDGLDEDARAAELCARWAGDVDVDRAAAFLDVRGGRPGRALQAIDAVLPRADGGSRCACLYVRAWALWDLGRRTEARRTLDEAVALAPSPVEAMLPAATAACFAVLDDERDLARDLAERYLPRARARGWRYPRYLLHAVLWAAADDPEVALSHARAHISLRRDRQLSTRQLGPLLRCALARHPVPDALRAELPDVAVAGAHADRPESPP